MTAPYSSIEKEGHRIVTSTMIGGGEVEHFRIDDRGLDPSNYINQPFSVNGDGTGATEQAAPAASYYIKPPNTQIYVLSHMNLYLEFSGAFSAANYGSLAALVNGILLHTHGINNAMVQNFTPIPIKKTSHWDLIGGSASISNLRGTGSGNNSFTASVEFQVGVNDFLVLDGSKGYNLALHIQDDLSGLVSQVATVQGRSYLLSDFSNLGT